MYIEQLDYSVTIPSVNGLETANFFGEHPIYGTVGYPTYEDAENDLHGILGFGRFLDCVESYIANGLIGDHYIFSPQNMIVEIVNEYEGWDWTPETGIVPWESEVEPEPEYPNRKSRRAIRLDRNKRKKGSDRAHGKRRKDSAKNLRRWENDEAQMERAQVMWHENNKGEYIPRPLDRKYHEKRYLRTTDTSRIPVYYVDTANHLDMKYRERKRTIKRGCVVYDYVPAIVTPEAVQGEPV